MGRIESGGKASLEALVESGTLGFQVLHPGGLELTRELAELCRAGPGQRLLDVASGTGGSACYLAEAFGCSVTGIDHSAFMVETAQRKARDRKLEVSFQLGDAHRLPFEPATFDVVISECTLCALDKAKVIAEMARVARSGCYVGISDLCWKDDAPSDIKSRLVDLEGERPEDVAGWVSLFSQAGLHDLHTEDRSEALASMSKEMRGELGLLAYLKVVLSVWRRWGLGGLARVRETEKLFASKHLGYLLIVGRKA